MELLEIVHGNLDKYPTWVQFSANAGVFVAAALIAAYGFYRAFIGRSPLPGASPNKQFVLEGATFGSDVMAREIRDAIYEVRDAVNDLAIHLKAFLMHTEVQNEVSKQLDRQGQGRRRPKPEED